MIRYDWGGVYILIINQLLPIALFIAILSFKAGDLMQLLGITGAAIALEFWDIIENLWAGILILLTAPAQGYKPPTLVVSSPNFRLLFYLPDSSVE
ncbi:mechanosensitive ion channel [Microcoleus sp. K1-B6]